jgi:hypothetical protein
MEITNKPFFEVQTFFLCLKSEPEINAENMIDDAPEDIGELSFNQFMLATRYDTHFYNSVEILHIFTGIEKKTLLLKKSVVILKTAKYYFEQMKKFIQIIQDIGERFKIPDKASVQLQDDYSWISIINIIAKGDYSQHTAIKQMPLYDVILMLKMELDINYSTYQKMKNHVL